jgi:hypothetical protein
MLKEIPYRTIPADIQPCAHGCQRFTLDQLKGAGFADWPTACGSLMELISRLHSTANLKIMELEMVKIFIVRRLVITVVWGDANWVTMEAKTKRTFFLSLHSSKQEGSTTFNFIAGRLAVIAGLAAI